MKKLMVLFTCLVFFGLGLKAQNDTTKVDPFLTNVTIEVNNINDPLLFASSVDISIKAAVGSEKYATQILYGTLDIGEERILQMDVLNKKVTKSTIFNSKVSFLFNSRSSDDFIGLFNFIFDFSDGSTYNYKFGKLTIGNDMKLSSITRGIYVH
jgi:hypothetical protein